MDPDLRLVVLLIFLAYQAYYVFMACVVFLLYAGYLASSIIRRVSKGLMTPSIEAQTCRRPCSTRVDSCIWHDPCLSFCLPLYVLASARSSIHCSMIHILPKALKLSSTGVVLIWLVPIIAKGINLNLISSSRESWASIFLASSKPIRWHVHLSTLLAIASHIGWFVSTYSPHFHWTATAAEVYSTCLSKWGIFSLPWPLSISSGLVSRDRPPLKIGLKIPLVPSCIPFESCVTTLIRIVGFVKHIPLHQILLWSIIAEVPWKLSLPDILRVVSCQTMKFSLIKWFSDCMNSLFGSACATRVAKRQPFCSSWGTWRISNSWRVDSCFNRWFVVANV